MQICCRPSRPRYASTTSTLRPRYVHQVLDRTIPRFLDVLTASQKTALRSYHVLAVPNTSLVGSYHVHTRFELRPPRFINFVLIVPYPQAIVFAFIRLALLQGDHTLLGAQAALVLFDRRRNRRTISCWVRPWLSAERRLQYGH